MKFRLVSIQIWLGLHLVTGRPNAIINDPALFASQSFDIVIVGGGTAGLIAAARLSEDDLNVGVIEAGEVIRGDPNIDYIINYGVALGNPVYDWRYTSVPQPNLGGRTVSESTGRLLGGSSAICDVLWQRASAAEYDVWGTNLQNGGNWSFEGLLPYFKKAESWSQPPVQLPMSQFSASLLETHNWSGPLHVGYNNYFPDPIMPSVESGNRLGIMTNADPDSGNSTGFLTPARAVDPLTGNRTYTLNAYLDPILNRPNLLVLTGGQVVKINFNKQTKTSTDDIVASGIEYVAGNRTFNATISKEVIITAELSGIGNKTLLDTLEIETLVDLPGVGENLIDQTAILMDYKVKDGVQTLDQLRFNTTFQRAQANEFAKSRTGVMTYDTAAVANVALKTAFSTSQVAELAAALHSYAGGKDLRPLQRAQYDILDAFLAEGKNAWVEFLLYAGGGYASVPEGNNSYVTPFAFHLHPLSRGCAHINSSDPLAAPTIDPRYFESYFDVLVSAMSASWIRNWMSTPPLSEILIGPNSPPESVQTPQDFESYVRQVAISTSHPIGTASMAPRSWGGVVDPDLKVYGTENVRVLDASIQPMTIGVAPLATVYAIAEKGSDIIKAAISVKFVSN